MNSQIGKNANHKFSLHNLSNKNGKDLTVFPLENRLTCLNINFRKRRENYEPTPTQIMLKHYVFINKKCNNSTLNCEAYSSFEGVSSDHRIVTAKT